MLWFEYGMATPWYSAGGMIFVSAINFRRCGLAGEAGHCGLILGGGSSLILSLLLLPRCHELSNSV